MRSSIQRHFLLSSFHRYHLSPVFFIQYILYEKHKNPDIQHMFLSSKNKIGSHLGNTNNPYFYLWIIASIISSIFAYTWDVKMDWGLFDLKSKDNKFLREETVYSSNVSIHSVLLIFSHFLVVCFFSKCMKEC